MNREKLAALMAGSINPRKFEHEIAEEVGRWVAILKKRGSSAPIYLSQSGPTIIVSSSSAAHLIEAALASEMSIDSFRYVLEGLLLDPAVEWPDPCVRDCMERISSLADANELSHDELQKARAELNGGA